MATKATTLFSLAAAKTYLEVIGDTKDDVITQIADAVSARVESLCQRPFVSRVYTEYHDARGRQDLMLDQFPIASMTTLKKRSSMTAGWETIDADSYEVDDAAGIIYLKDESFYDGTRTVEAVYSAGFGAQDAATLPSDVVQAAKEYLKFVWTRWQNGLIMSSSANMGQVSVLVIPEPPKDVRDALLPWRKLRLSTR